MGVQRPSGRSSTVSTEADGAVRLAADSLLELVI